MPSLLALTTPLLSSFRAELSVTGEPRFHHLSSSGNPTIEFAGPPSPSPALRSDSAHGFFSSEINQKFRYFGQFALKPLGFSKINPRFTNFCSSARNSKNIYKKVPSLRKIHKNSSKIPKIHIFPTTTPNPVILVPKFLESLPLSFYAFI
jgi:hypothetical protein